MSDEQINEQPPETRAAAELGITKIDLNQAPVPIGDVLNEIMPQGEKAEFKDWVDETIVVRSIRAFTGQFGQAAFVLFTDENGALYNFVIGSKVVLPKLLAAQSYLPVSMKIIKVEGGQFGEYYDIE